MSTDALREAVDLSGFPLEMRLEYEIRQTRHAHGWNVVEPQYPWRGPDGRAGFIDLVLKKDIYVATLECKRVDESWIFLTSADARREPTAQVRCRWTQMWNDDRGVLTGYHEANFRPTSEQAEYCVIQRPSARRSRGELLESIAAPLVQATDAIAEEHYQISRAQVPDFRAMYIPIIVTTARLFIAHLATSEIDLESGTVPTDTRFDQVNCIRFRKSLAQDLLDEEGIRTLSEAKRDRDRTVIVVSAVALGDVLAEWRGFGSQRWPEMLG